MGVSQNRGTPKSSILIGFSIIFTIHFWGFPPYFWRHPVEHQVGSSPPKSCSHFSIHVINIDDAGGSAPRHVTPRGHGLFARSQLEGLRGSRQVLREDRIHGNWEDVPSIAKPFFSHKFMVNVGKNTHGSYGKRGNTSTKWVNFSPKTMLRLRDGNMLLANSLWTSRTNDTA